MEIICWVMYSNIESSLLEYTALKKGKEFSAPFITSPRLPFSVVEIYLKLMLLLTISVSQTLKSCFMLLFPNSMTIIHLLLD